MILPVLKYCLPIYLLLAGLLLLGVKGGHSLAAVLILLGLIIAITVLGLILGMLLSVLIRRPKLERWFYLIGQVVAFGVIVIPFLNILFSC
jgi:hypothetical protein